MLTFSKNNIAEVRWKSVHKIRIERLDIFKKLFPWMKQCKSLYYILGGLKLYTLILTLIVPMFYLMLINDVMIGKNINMLLWVVFGYVGVYLLQTAGVVFNKRTYNKLFFKFNLNLKTQVLSKYTKMKSVQYSEYNVGDLKNRLDGDIALVEKFFNAHILDYIYAVISALVITVILFVLSPILALTGFVMVPVSFWFAKFMGKKVAKLTVVHRECYGKYESFLHSTFQNWKEIKSNNLEKSQNDIFQDFRVKLSKLFVKNQIYWFTNRAFISFKDFFITKMNLYFIGGLLIINGQMNVGTLLVFMNYYAQFFDNISQITDSILGLKNDKVIIDRVLEILDISLERKLFVRNLGDSITISDLSFSYNKDQKAVLKNVNVQIAPREHVAIVGRSGCGKSSLVKLILGLYEPQEGAVCIGDHDISKIAVESVGKKVSIVMQDPSLFNLTIAENLTFAKRKVTLEEMMCACRQANIHDFIENLPDKYETIIGERGIKLSGGQKQRLAIARTILQNPDIIIFDEATSSLDSKNEKAIVSAIKELSHDKTIITISHRLSTIMDCDRIIVMDDGKVIEINKHSDLRDSNEIYNLLFSNQYQDLIS